MTTSTLLLVVFIYVGPIDGISSAFDGLASAGNSKTSYDSRVKANEISKYIPDIYYY